MSEDEKASWLQNVLRLIARRILGNAAQMAERYVKRAIRMLAMSLMGVVIAVLGVAFFAIGAVKWFSLVIPSWQAWTIVGVILLLVGGVLAGATLVGSRS